MSEIAWFFSDMKQMESQMLFFFFEQLKLKSEMFYVYRYLKDNI